MLEDSLGTAARFGEPKVSFVKDVTFSQPSKLKIAGKNMGNEMRLGNLGETKNQVRNLFKQRGG